MIEDCECPDHRAERAERELADAQAVAMGLVRERKRAEMRELLEEWDRVLPEFVREVMSP